MSENMSVVVGLFCIVLIFSVIGWCIKTAFSLPGIYTDAYRKARAKDKQAARECALAAGITIEELDEQDRKDARAKLVLGLALMKPLTFVGMVVLTIVLLVAFNFVAVPVCVGLWFAWSRWMRNYYESRREA